MKMIRIILLIIAAIIMFGCKKETKNGGVIQAQPTPILCKFAFSKSMLTDSTICIYSFGSSIRQNKIIYSLSDSSLVNIGDTIKCQMVNYSTQTAFDNHIMVGVPFGNVLKQINPVPTCTNCVYSTVTSHYDAYKVSQVFTLVVN